MSCGIYTITCTINNRVYVGQSGNIKKRWGEHIRMLSNDRHDNPFLQASVNKYGIEFFRFNIVEECAVELLVEREQYWMDYYRVMETGFNMLPAAGSRRGYKATPETRAKISAASKGKVHTAEARAKISAAMKGQVRTAEHQAKLTAARSKPIILVAPDGTETEWCSAAEAARQLGLAQGNLSDILLGKRKHHKGYTARYKEAN